MRDKIFLSHSSEDKDYVKPIADILGKDLCIYDEMCFEEGIQTLEEIFKGLNQTSLFVLFISDASLNSDWVKREIIEAEKSSWNSSSRLRQIFPIIIDDKITHNDVRIPPFLKDKFGAYNIRHIKNSKVAARKIQTQYTKNLLLIHNHIEIGYSYGRFYGRNSEIAEFQKHFDEGQPARCLVVSGIQGIGKRSFIVNALRASCIIEEYYEPPIISMATDDDITDLIMRLSELGFGDYTLESINNLHSMNEKIEALSSTLSEVQRCKEHVIIYDQTCIVGYDGEPKYWFERALNSIRTEISISLAAYNTISDMVLRKNKNYISISLSTLKRAEWKGLLRVYGEEKGISFDVEDRDYFDDIITGYPPQVLFCVDLAKQEGMEYVKHNGAKIISDISDNVAQILNAALESVEDEKKVGQGFLAFLSNYGVMPLKNLLEVIEIRKSYAEYYRHFKSLTICRLIGAKNDYVQVNPVIADFVQRNRYKENEDISSYLNNQFDMFIESLSKEDGINDIDFELLKLYLKNSIKKKIFVPGNLLYSTIYISAVRELYNDNKYARVIEIIDELKETRVLERFDFEIEERLQRYYCQALARQLDSRFYDEVKWYKKNIYRDNEKYGNSYHYLMGFMYRLEGDYDRAVIEYQKVLKQSPNNKTARREIVASYSGMEEYDVCRQYAEANYRQDPSNRFYLQDYFEILIHSDDITNRIKDDCQDGDFCTLNRLMDQLENIYSLNENKDPFYYEIKAKYSAYVDNNYDEAMKYLNIGISLNSESPFLKITKYDILEKKNDIQGMGEALDEIKCLIENKENKRTELAYKRRLLFFDAYNGKDIHLLMIELGNMKGISDQSRKKIERKLYWISENATSRL